MHGVPVAGGPAARMAADEQALPEEPMMLMVEEPMAPEAAIAEDQQGAEILEAPMLEMEMAEETPLRSDAWEEGEKVFDTPAAGQTPLPAEGAAPPVGLVAEPSPTPSTMVDIEPPARMEEVDRRGAFPTLPLLRGSEILLGVAVLVLAILMFRTRKKRS